MTHYYYYYYYKIINVNVYYSTTFLLYSIYSGDSIELDLNLKPFRGNNNITNYIFHTKKNVQFKTSNKY